MILQMTSVLFYRNYRFMGPIVHIHVVMNYVEYITINTVSTYFLIIQYLIRFSFVQTKSGLV